MAAVLMLVFKDPILACCRYPASANDMLKSKDWLEMPKYMADGAVIDIGLTTVKVRTGDNTITTIPTVTGFDSFSNQAACLRPADAGLNVVLILTRPVSIF